MTQLLLEKGATINTFDKKDRRAVHWAAYMGHVDIVRLLVSFGAELGCRDKQVWLHHIASASFLSASACSLLCEYLYCIVVFSEVIICLLILFLGGWWRWALLSPDGVVPSRMVGVSASVNHPLHHKVQKFSSGTGSESHGQVVYDFLVS